VMRMNRKAGNEKARRNGWKNEQEAMTLLFLVMDKAERIEYVNKLFDILVNDTVPVEVKSCQEWIKDSSTSTKRRRGRFWLSKEQHDYLVANNGYYFFIVELENGRKLFKLVKAEDLEFKYTIVWAKLPLLIKKPHLTIIPVSKEKFRKYYKQEKEGGEEEWEVYIEESE